MIKDNRITFGYGTVACGSSHNTLIYTEIKPPQEIGKNITNEVEYGKEIEIKVDNEEFNMLLKDINNVENNKEILFKGYILDFNKYNLKSIEAVKKQINRARMYDLMAFAC